MKTTAREVGQVIFGACDSHLCDEQENGELEGWTVIEQGDGLLLVSIGTEQTFIVRILEVTK